MEHDKSNTLFLYEIVIVYFPFYLRKTIYVISSSSLSAKAQKLILDAIIIP